MLRLNGLLSHAAACDPGRTAVIFNEVSWTYDEVHNHAQRLASALAGFDVQRGDRVALWAPNCAEFVEILFGIPMLGAIAVPLDHWWKAKDALVAITEAEPKVLIVGESQASQLVGLEAEMKAAGVQHVLTLTDSQIDGFKPYARTIAAAEPLAEPASVEENDPALILFTSGSTGRSKGAVHTHRDLCSTALIMGIETELSKGERTLHFLPMFSSCLEHLIPLTLMGATHVIMPHFDAKGVWEAIEKHQITHIDAVPTTLRRLLEHVPAKVPQSLRRVVYASEPMPAPLISALMEAIPNAEFVQIYGMIEQLCLTVQGTSHQVTKLGTVGHPMIGANLRIVDEEGQPVPQGEQGEILAQTPTQFSGYWNNPDVTAQVMRDGWMKTGDIGYFDADGFLVLSGRLKEVIKSGGVTVIPSEVESALLKHDAVREAAVIGVPDDTWGEAVHAFVVLHDGAEIAAQDLVAFCRTQLAGYKTPKSIHYIDDLPRTGIGKISRKQVREQYLRTQELQVNA